MAFLGLSSSTYLRTVVEIRKLGSVDFHIFIYAILCNRFFFSRNCSGVGWNATVGTVVRNLGFSKVRTAKRRSARRHRQWPLGLLAGADNITQCANYGTFVSDIHLPR
jgi:hypothetical protein